MLVYRSDGKALAENPSVGVKDELLARFDFFPAAQRDRNLSTRKVGQGFRRLDNFIHPDGDRAVVDGNLRHRRRFEFPHRPLENEVRLHGEGFLAYTSWHIDLLRTLFRRSERSYLGYDTAHG